HLQLLRALRRPCGRAMLPARAPRYAPFIPALDPRGRHRRFAQDLAVREAARPARLRNPLNEPRLAKAIGAAAQAPISMGIRSCFMYFRRIFGIASLAMLAGHSPHAQETQPEEIVVTSTALRETALEVAQPASVLGGDALRRQIASSLGETIASEPGVSATYFGPSSSRPVIRGLGGERVLMLHDGMSALDVSSLSQDHAVAGETVLADQTEILRGPATRLFGSGAGGGAVNVVHGRIPRDFTTDGGRPSGGRRRRGRQRRRWPHSDGFHDRRGPAQRRATRRYRARRAVDRWAARARRAIGARARGCVPTRDERRQHPRLRLLCCRTCGAPRGG